MIIPKLGGSLAYGGDYNPEQWPESVWIEDMRLMREAGVNFVTVAVFSWARIQPAEGEFDFGWLDRVMDLLAAHGIYADLATATASPPPWMSVHYPDVLAVDSSGMSYHPGSRQHYSPCSPSFRRLAAALVERLAARYASHPALAAWHISNEYTCHIPECHSAAATEEFRCWLRRKYGTIAVLNAAWGTTFWSQGYGAWEEILTPRRAPYAANPTQALDYKRFMNDAVFALYTMERDILAAASPDVPITTNVMGFHKPLDLHAWSHAMDFIGWNSYPDPTPGARGECAAAAGHDLMRSLKRDRPFILMEQSTASVNWHPVCPTKPPGLMRLWSHQAVARGADGVMFFQWRASRFGAEKFMSGMVQHAGTEQNRIFEEVKALGAEFAALAPVRDSSVRARVAILFDWENWWAVELDAKPARFALIPWVQAIHQHFFAANIAVDFVHPSTPLDDYALVVAPMLYLLRANDAENLAGFVSRGGTLLATYFTGVVDENDHVVLGGYPARLREVLGAWVEEWLPGVDELSNGFRFTRESKAATTTQHACGQWCEVVHPEGATVLARFVRDFIAGRPALTVNQHGRGRAYYLATRPTPAGLGAVLDLVCRQADVAPPVRTPPGVEATLRTGKDASFLFLLNHTGAPARIPLKGIRGRDLISGRPIAGRTIELPARGVAVIEHRGPTSTNPARAPRTAQDTRARRTRVLSSAR